MTLPPMRHLTPELCRSLEAEMRAACSEIAARRGLLVEERGISEMNLRNYFEFSLRVHIPLPDGSIFDPEKSLFEGLAETYGLKPEVYGRRFLARGDWYKITALAPNRPRYPVSAERLGDGHGFKFTAEEVVRLLEVSPVRSWDKP